VDVHEAKHGFDLRVVAMTDLANRYGAPSPARRRALLVLVVLVAAAGLAWLAWAAIYESTPKVQSEFAGFVIVDDHTATAEFTVNRHDGDVRATCFLRAIADDHSIVGELTEAIRPGSGKTRVKVTIRTERRATSVDLLGCAAPGQNRRR
jgi:hypothetical protein